MDDPNGFKLSGLGQKVQSAIEGGIMATPHGKILSAAPGGKEIVDFVAEYGGRNTHSSIAFNLFYYGAIIVVLIVLGLVVAEFFGGVWESIAGWFNDAGEAIQHSPVGLPMDCADGEVNRGGLCYPKCPSGYESNGTTLCYKECPTDKGGNGKPLFPNHTITECTKGRAERKIAGPLHACESGWDKIGALCYKKCPSGYKEDGIRCKSTKKGSYGRGAGYPLTEKSKCEQEAKKQGSKGCEQNGALLYPKCRSGYKASGCCVCTLQKADSTGRETKPLGCADDEELDGALCYKKSPSGYKCTASTCWAICPKGFTDTGVNCQRPVVDPGKGKPGVPIHSCDQVKDHPIRIAGLCYKHCDEGYCRGKGANPDAPLTMCVPAKDDRSNCAPKSKDGYSFD